MKNLVFIFFLFTYSCTSITQADTAVSCPCKVIGVKWNGSEYEILTTSISDEQEWLIFHTSTSHSIGDTIK